MLRNVNKRPPVLRAREALELFILMKNRPTQKEAACNSAFILSIHAAKRR